MLLSRRFFTRSYYMIIDRNKTIIIVQLALIKLILYDLLIIYRILDQFLCLILNSLISNINKYNVEELQS